MVEHPPHHPMVGGLSPATAAGTGRDNGVNATILRTHFLVTSAKVFIKETFIVNHLRCSNY